MRIGLFPGTFDPITLGHIDIIDRALPLFDKLFIGIGRNANKKPLFPEEDRLSWIRECFAGEKRIEAVIYEGLTVECCKSIGATFILRGIRYVNDFEYEKAIADMNRSIINGVESIFFNLYTPIYLRGINPCARCVQKWGRCKAISPCPGYKNPLPVIN